MKKLLLTSTLLAGLANAQFDNVGTSAANFLKIGVGSRAEGMGGAYTAQVSDATAMYWNPSGLAHIKQPQVVFNYFDWVADMKYSYMGVTIPAGRTGTFGYISDRFVVGIQAKLIRETISFSNASAFAVDVGSQYLTDFYGLRIGMSVSNFGTKMRLYGTDNKVDVDAYEDLDANPDVVAHLNTDDWSLPMAFRFGLSMTPVGKEGIIKQDLAEVTVNWEYFDPRDFNPYYVLGFEAKVMDMLYLRTGYQFKFRRFSESLDDNSSDEDFQSALDDENGNGYADPNLSWGVGFDAEKISYVPVKMRVDFSHSAMGLLGDVQRFTISISF